MSNRGYNEMLVCPDDMSCLQCGSELHSEQPDMNAPAYFGFCDGKCMYDRINELC